VEELLSTVNLNYFTKVSFVQSQIVVLY